MKILFFFSFILALTPVISCSQQKIVEEHFKNHGLTYPVDSAGLGLLGVEYVGIKEDELKAPGAREYIEEGIAFIKDYFQERNIRDYMPGAYAAVLSRPVLYRDDTGDVGFMVSVTAFGAGQPGAETKGIIKMLDMTKNLWSAENFAYFFRNDLYQWKYGGMVY